MKKTGLLLITALFSLTAVLAQKEQKVIYDDNVQKRSIGSFKSIESSAGIEVIISKSDKEELAVSASRPEFLDEVKTVVQNGVLKIYRSNDWNFWREWKNWRIRVYVSYTQLEELRANSGASIKCSDLALEKLTAKLNSGATMTLSGTVNSLNVDGSSGAQFHGYELTSTMCTAEASSGAGVQINVSKEITARANSGGFVRFKGEGLIRDVNVNSGGSVKRS
jgi:hypothetical protein